ncbi:polysaccharide deacetylase family protein [Enterovibrio sp. ZSDZ35]|uniref:Polysaccharide deacetylase family protein n=1 Tax=Enterovibrio qingdaonensis TaxID=2899818 RepID=A0ABT5QNC4_9GAMM|nr:polysaccharide deacetylase family protein [Enterovibrio sp. ZSDZ35]MDD1782485.1 polysaccharide deacetylase family protein [Enterovibrio sp. ZSDZ35]
MIGILNTGSSAYKYVLSAFKRSFTDSQIVELSDLCTFKSENVDALVLVSPSEEELNATLNSDGVYKVIIFGCIPPSHAEALKFRVSSWPEGEWGKAPSAETYSFSESAELIEYTEFANVCFGSIKNRPMERFDFMDEWNNLGYGAVKTEGDIWSLSTPIIFDENALSNVTNDGDLICSFSSLIDIDEKSFLWFNREVGPVDSYEWQIVEAYLSSNLMGGNTVYPVLVEVPNGFDCAITMRLDCDEDIESSRYLWNAYKIENIPFSLAIHTMNLTDERHFPIMRELEEAGDAILSHTATHAPNWGGSYESALYEANTSANLIEKVINKRVKYAVSPFHHTPLYALKALSDAGYKGCIGGIIKNDPEFLTFNGGNLAELPKSFIGHSQQVMLHGDCILNDSGDSLRVYKESFDIAKQSNTIFGYLDHPFSERYQYGWLTEEQRKNVHLELINYIRTNSNSPCFMNEIEAMDFIQDKANYLVKLENGLPVLKLAEGYKRLSSYVPKVLLNGQVQEVLISE